MDREYIINYHSNLNGDAFEVRVEAKSRNDAIKKFRKGIGSNPGFKLTNVREEDDEQQRLI